MIVAVFLLKVLISNSGQDGLAVKGAVSRTAPHLLRTFAAPFNMIKVAFMFDHNGPSVGHHVLQILKKM